MSQKIGLDFQLKKYDENGELLLYSSGYNFLSCITVEKDYSIIDEYGKHTPRNDKWKPYQGLTSYQRYKFLYYNVNTDNWYDLVYHFMYGDEFIGMYINDAGDVIAHYTLPSKYLDLYHLIRRDTFVIKTYSIDYKKTVSLHETIVDPNRFTKIRDRRNCFGGEIKENVVDFMKEFFSDFKTFIENDHYVTKKMLKMMITGDHKNVLNDGLYDLCVICV